MAKKISDEQLIELIEQGQSNSEIASSLGVTVGGIYPRLKKLRKNHKPLVQDQEPAKEFDLQLYDTVVIDHERFTVVAIRNTEFDVRSQNKRPQVTKTFLKRQYVTGKPAPIQKKDFAPVNTYVDESLIEKRVPAVVNPEFEAEVQDMIASRKSEPVVEVEVDPESEPDQEEPAPEPEVCSEPDTLVADSWVNSIPEELFDHFTQVMAKDAQELVAYRGEIRKQIDAGQPVNVSIVNRYNRVVRHYYNPTDLEKLYDRVCDGCPLERLL